jgi:glycosyltransferase involved in cell wall biosynthesis
VRVLLLVTDLQRGGTPHRIARYARLLHGAHWTPPAAASTHTPSHDSHVAAAGLSLPETIEPIVGCLAPPGPVSAELEREGIATFACGARGAWDLRALARLAAEVRRRRPALLHATLFHANLAARLVGRCLRVPVLTSTATIEVERPWHLRWERATSGWDAGRLVTSTALAEHVHTACGVPRARIFLIPPALAPPPAESSQHATLRAAARTRFNLPPDRFVLAWAGRMDPVKRVERVLAVAARLTSPRQPVSVLLAGAGPEQDRLQAHARQQPEVETLFLGWQADLSGLFHSADVLVLPSRTEGLPNVALEALAHGLPVVAHDLPGLRELARECAGLLLAPHDTLQDLAACVGQLAADPSVRARRARAGWDWGQTALRPEAARAALLSAYRAVLADR